MRSGPAVAALALALALPGGTAAQSWRTVTMSRQASEERSLDVRITYGAGHFKVRAAEPGILYRMQLRYDEDTFAPRAEFEKNRLHLGIENLGRSIRFGKDRSGGEMDLALGRGIPMDLEMEFGAVRADIDLGGLSLTRLDLKTGASEADVDVSVPNVSEMRTASLQIGAADFTARHLGNLNAERISIDAGVGEVSLWFNGKWTRDATVSIDMGLGSLELVFPEGLGVRLKKDSFLTSLDSEGMVKRGDAYYSLDWDTAPRKLTVDLDAAFGSVQVRWVR